jgi:hypothetical protein
MPLLQALAGSRGDDGALKAAETSDDAEEDQCEANYYLGMLHGSKDFLLKATDEDCAFSDLAREALAQSR